MKHTTPMFLTLQLQQEQIVDALTSSDIKREELLNLFTTLDLAVAEVDFTEELIRRLVKSLKADHEDTNLPFIDWEKV